MCTLCHAGDPFHLRYWMAQCGIYLLIMLVEKICIGPLILFSFWSKVSVILYAVYCMWSVYVHVHVCSCCLNTIIGNVLS